MVHIYKHGLRQDGTLECSSCHQFKLPEEFSPEKQGKFTNRGNRNYRCRMCKRIKHNDWKMRNPDKVKASLAQWKAKVKKQCLDHYGAECAWCGEKDLGLLTLDHVNNDGNLERKKLGICWMWHLVVKNGFPKSYQILCMGCNCYKAWHGRLPESKKRSEIKMFSLSDYAMKGEAA